MNIALCIKMAKNVSIANEYILRINFCQSRKRPLILCMIFCLAFFKLMFTLDFNPFEIENDLITFFANQAKVS